MHCRGGPHVAIAFGPGGPLTAQLRAVDSLGRGGGGTSFRGDRRKHDRPTTFLW